MPWTLLILAALAMLCASGWVLAELELRDANSDRDDLEAELEIVRRDRDIAEALVDRDMFVETVTHPSLTLLDGGEL